MAVFRHPGWRWPDFSGAMDDFERARRQMDRLLTAVTGSGLPAAVSGVFPPLVVKENEESISVEAEIPGIRAEDLDISVVGRTLTVSGERKPDETQNATYHRRERKWGSFSKALTLPVDVNAERIVAECKNGVLKIVLPKAENTRSRKISIKGE